VKFEISVKEKTGIGGGILIFDDHGGSLKEYYAVTFIPSRGEISTNSVPQKARVNRVELGMILMKDIKRLAKAS